MSNLYRGLSKDASYQQGSHYFEIRGRSERQQGEVVRVQGEVKIFL
jgi:hypothetical protein